MTALATAFKTYEQKGLREDLQNSIYNIAPTDTPTMSNSGRGTMKATLTEWQTDTLDTATTANAQLEGDVITQFTTINATARVGNYAQISRKLVATSGTAEAVDKAGRDSELSYNVVKKLKSLKRDMETIINDNLAGNAGNATTARQTATLGAWLKTNIVFNTTDGVSPTYTSGVPSATRTDGTATTFTEAMLQSAMALCYASGAKPDTLQVGAFNKQIASTFTGIATKTIQQTALKQAAIIGAADFYVSNFGTLAIVPNRFQRGRDAFLFDFNYLSILFLRNFSTKPLPVAADAENRMILVEWGLKCHNEAALGSIVDLTTS